MPYPFLGVIAVCNITASSRALDAVRTACAYNQEAVGKQETRDFALYFIYIHIHVRRVAFGGEL